MTTTSNNQDNERPILLSTKQAANYLGYKPSYLAMSRHTGTLAGVRAPSHTNILNKIVYHIQDLKIWLEENGEADVRKYMNSVELAKMLGVEVQTIVNVTRRGMLYGRIFPDHEKIRSKLYFNRDEVNKFIVCIVDDLVKLDIHARAKGYHHEPAQRVNKYYTKHQNYHLKLFKMAQKNNWIQIKELRVINNLDSFFYKKNAI